MGRARLTTSLATRPPPEGRALPIPASIRGSSILPYHASPESLPLPAPPPSPLRLPARAIAPHDPPPSEGLPSPSPRAPRAPRGARRGGVRGWVCRIGGEQQRGAATGTAKGQQQRPPRAPRSESRGWVRGRGTSIGGEQQRAGSAGQGGGVPGQEDATRLGGAPFGGRGKTHSLTDSLTT